MRHVNKAHFLVESVRMWSSCDHMFNVRSFDLLVSL
jgi:hypothetical protein